MKNLLEVIQEINIHEKKIHKITRDDKTYDIEELKSFHKDLKELSSELRGFKIIKKECLSRRRGLIVILQEYFFKDFELN